MKILKTKSMPLLYKDLLRFQLELELSGHNVQSTEPKIYI